MITTNYSCRSLGLVSMPGSWPWRQWAAPVAGVRSTLIACGDDGRFGHVSLSPSRR
jgi:hypothetical protein